ncbi:hypothetical protein J2S09_000142 [Bacillus fengqiuensis]|nr:hypothetical protein [Bacillus fengqiuensis]
MNTDNKLEEISNSLFLLLLEELKNVTRNLEEDKETNSFEQIRRLFSAIRQLDPQRGNRIRTEFHISSWEVYIDDQPHIRKPHPYLNII